MAEEEKKSAYRGFTKAQEKAHKKYMENFAEVKVRMTKEKRETIQNHAKKMGLSTTQFINDAIDRQMQADNEKPLGNG